MPGEEKTLGDHVLVILFLVLVAVIAWAYWQRSRAGQTSSRSEVDIEVRGLGCCVEAMIESIRNYPESCAFNQRQQRDGDQKTRIRHERGI